MEHLAVDPRNPLFARPTLSDPSKISESVRAQSDKELSEFMSKYSNPPKHTRELGERRGVKRAHQDID